MKRLIKYTALFLFLAISCTILFFQGIDKGWWYASLAENSSPGAFTQAAQTEIEKGFKGNLVMTIIENGKVQAELFHSPGKKVDQNSLFQVASLSKFISAVGVMKLVEEGKLELDVPIQNYLTRWQLPPSDFDNSQVTVRALLSHTAGLTDGLGYSGFLSPDSVQTLEQSLTKAIDADKGKSGQVKVGVAPHSSWIYSGGGFTLLQLIIEERSGQGFAEYMKEQVFEPMGMESSYFQLPISEYPKLVDFYYHDGSLAPHFYYSSLAATSLYTSLAVLEIIFQLFTNRKNTLLSSESIQLMQEPLGYKMGVPTYGLGTFLYTQSPEGQFIIGHDGMSNPPINTALRINPSNGDGIIILETGHEDLATRLASDWVHVTTGKVDNLLFLILLEDNMNLFIKGILVLIAGVFTLGISRRKKK